ncbi:MAG: hypothetical protein ACREID_02830 [Planctomycetota bacterium]
MSDKAHSFLVRLLALAVGVFGLVHLVNGLEGGSGLRVLWVLAVGVLWLATALGLYRFRGWAWLVATLAMLGGCVLNFIRMIAAIDAGRSGDAWSHAWTVVSLALVLAYLGRESMERRFRPHIAAEH